MDKLFGSSAKTDRGNQLAATQGEWNLFNYGLPAGQAGEKIGTEDLGVAKSRLNEVGDYFKSLMRPGRTDATLRAAPATNSVQTGSDAVKQAEGTFGTDRTGGTVAANREESSATRSKIDDIITSTLLSDRAQGAEGTMRVASGEAGIAGQELSNALSLLGLSKSSIDSILNNATQSRELSYKINQDQAQGYGQALGALAKKLMVTFGA